MGLDGILTTLQQKYNSAAGPWKWAIAVLIALMVVGGIGYYIYKWMIVTIDQDGQATRKTFGRISIKFHSKAHKQLYKDLRKTHWASNPLFLEAVGTVRTYGPGRHWKMFGAHSFNITRFTPRNFEYELLVPRGKRMSAFRIKVLVVLAMENIVRLQLTNSAIDELLGAQAGNGLVKVQGIKKIWREFEAGRNDLIGDLLREFVTEDLEKAGARLDSVYFVIKTEATEYLMPRVIEEKEFLGEEVSEKLVSLVDWFIDNGPPTPKQPLPQAA
jgi:hypothetical protein